MMNVRFKRVKGLFVTGTDTGVGKTLVAGAIAHQLAGEGMKVGVFKPVATGCRLEREGLVSRDAEFLAHCCDSRFSLDEINPIRYKQPLAPSVAAEMSQREIDWDKLQIAYQNISKGSDVTIVEGIGGVMVPLARDYMVADLIKDMGLPVLIVARNSLGTINHTLMTVELCRNKGIKIAGVIINQYITDSCDTSEETNPRIISEISRIRVICVIPYDKISCVEEGRLGREVISAVSVVNWQEWME
ncbi:MAG: dethiobiotin synthase [Sedimentisphaerales bacterium]|nr:dethiobiotin synthase [Sedimentisphaerales bacterium]